jgi:tetratricopeptide (TPR) repeat protein
MRNAKRGIKSRRPKTERKKTKSNLRSPAFVCGFVFLCLIVCAVFLNDTTQKVSAEDGSGEIEKALFARQVFFGAEAIVPLPTAEARENLARLAENAPDNLQILEKLAELDEKLSRFDEAEKILIHLAEIDAARLGALAAFYERRGEFQKEAEILKKILFSIDAERRGAAFENLINLARMHDLREYLQTDFYAQVAKENPNVYTIFETLIDNLVEEKNYAEALSFVRQAKTQFPARASVLLGKEVDILLETGDAKEAENVYQSAFNPFWTDDEAQKFYDFLSEHDRLRAYGAEIRTKFKKNPADFDAAIRLALYQNYDYSYGNDSIAPIVLKLEQAKKNWTTDELVTVTRLLLREGEADLAARFLYTLYLREDFQKSGELRAKVLYQLFEMFSDAQSNRLPLSKGDLRFYEDVAKADTKPGIATGILSLIFSDTSPRALLEEKETEANKYFNRAAAYRIFEEYKNEFPSSSELAQMYLDIFRLYTADGETEIAEKTLNEFAGKFEKSSDYADAAMKLADAFVAVKNNEKAREIYQKALDYLGKKGKIKRKNSPAFSDDSNVSEIAPDRNDGINVPQPEETTVNVYDVDEKRSVFRDYLARKNTEITYEEVLETFVASFAREKKTAEILALYSNEINKYADEQWLYEQRLAWLEQTNLVDEQLQTYQAALARFQTRAWQDKLARFFLRENRNEEFAALSEDLIGKLNDIEAQSYLSQFVDGKGASTDFQKRLYLKLYQSAHVRFPHNPVFVAGLLRFYKSENQADEWRALAAEYYFELPDVRREFLDDLAQKGELRAFLAKSGGDTAIYELFRADAAVRLSNYEAAVEAYRKLNRIYPNEAQFSGRLINFTRSFGQKNREFLAEASDASHASAEFMPSSAENRTQSGEIYAELGDYRKAREEWEKLVSTGAGAKETYLDTATVYWDYFQYADALRTIGVLRAKFRDETLYAFEAGAILEAEHKQAEAVREYVKALGANRDEEQKEKAKKRLANLWANEATKNSLEKEIQAAFLSESAKRADNAFLALGYAEFLFKVKLDEKGENVLKQAIGRSKNKEFLEAARNFCQSEENVSGEQSVLKRLADVSASSRQTISYRLQLAESFEDEGDRDSAKIELAGLVRKFPTNYGVVAETSDFYYRLGFERESADVLQSALSKSRGQYQTALAEKLGKRLIQSNQLDSAEQILTRLHDENHADTEIFRELAKIYVRTNKPEAMRRAFGETVAEMKKSDAEPRELEAEIADLRGEMIDAFTRLKDYRSAIEQHIEIINREPEDEESTENAIAYANRYGGAQTLLDYYLKTSAEAFKNYRWNVVLARIYEAKGDFENASKSYRAAIDNQPEMEELYVALAEAETKRNNYDAALESIDTALELSNDAPQYVKKKIEILIKAGKLAEAEAEKAKLPAGEEKKMAGGTFDEAQKLKQNEKEKARAAFREAFEKLLENPLEGELKTADISAYVQSVREEEPLDKIDERLWLLREKLIEIADENDSTDAGEARRRLETLDAAMLESIGGIAKSIATDEELAALHQNLENRLEKSASDAHRTISLVQDLSRRAGFGDLEEKILLRKLDEAGGREIYLPNLLNFYRERGAYQKSFDVLEKYGSENLSLKAETARLVGNGEKELEALRAIYWKVSDKPGPAPVEDVKRYLEILDGQNQAELKSLTEKNSAYQLQLINFLLGKGEREMANAAIESANQPPAWKLARKSETSLALKDFDACYFCAALELDSIGNLVKQTPDKKRFLINDDWFRLAREYGEWLYQRKDKTPSPAAFLTAMIERLPQNSNEQEKLGQFYLEKNEFKAAIEHFRLALETDETNTAAGIYLGAAYFKSGRKDFAGEMWTGVLEAEDFKSALLYFQILQKNDLAAVARENLSPAIVKFLEKSNAEDSEDFQNLIRAVAASFASEAEKTAYFRQILNRRPGDVSLAAMLTGESLIGENERKAFYELLIERSDALNDYDYEYKSTLEKVWTAADAESVYDSENDYKTPEQKNEKLEWQRKYLEIAEKENDDANAAKTIAQIEKDINGRFARPEWLRLAAFKLQIRAGKFDGMEAERFVGVTVSDSVTEIKPPSLERFNEVLHILKDENRAAEASRFSEAFFARMLALEQFDAANFAGLARAYFLEGETEKALRIVRLMIDAADESKRETALAEITSTDAVKARAADAAKLSGTSTARALTPPEALRLAAEISAEFREPQAAIDFRRALLAASPLDWANQIELAKLLVADDKKSDAINLLSEIINNRNALRPVRWQARMLLRDAGADADFPNQKFDAFSQFYQGILSEKRGENESAAGFFINSLVAGKDSETAARQELVKTYVLLNEPVAALKLVETDKSAKSDAVLQMLSETAEKVGDYAKAIGFEKAKQAPDAKKINRLQEFAGRQNQKATDFTVDLENTRKL